MGLMKKSLLMLALNISVADNADVKLMGCAFINLKSTSGHNSKHIVYFAQGVKDFYLYKSACRDLHIINEEFPTIVSADTSTSCARVSGKPLPYTPDERSGKPLVPLPTALLLQTHQQVAPTLQWPPVHHHAHLYPRFLTNTHS